MNSTQTNQPFITLLELDLRKREFEIAVSRVDEITKRIDFDSLIQNPNVLYSILDSYVAIKNNNDLLKFINYIHGKVFNPENFIIGQRRCLMKSVNGR